MQNQTTVALLTSLMFFFTCKTEIKKDETKNLNIDDNQEALCEKISIKGDKLILCREWNELGKQKVIVVSKKRQGNTKTEFFVDVYSENDLSESLTGIYDFIEDCPVDFFINYIEGSLTITDLDNDGLKEISFLYELSCQGDISPAKMKLIMFEGKNKFKLRGMRQNRATMELNQEFGYGKYTVDKSFEEAPDSFLEHARKLWEKYVKED